LGDLVIRNRYVEILLGDEVVARWELGFCLLGELLAYEVALHDLDEWPELAHARREPYGWRLVFVWRDRGEVIS
jgi:hypothetical protein